MSAVGDPKAGSGAGQEASAGAERSDALVEDAPQAAHDGGASDGGERVGEATSGAVAAVVEARADAAVQPEEARPRSGAEVDGGSVPPEEWCAVCVQRLRPGARFCGGCGAAVVAQGKSRAFDDVRMLLGFFLAAMAIAVFWGVWFRVTEDAFVSDLGIGGSLAALTVGYGIWHRDLLAGALRTAGFSAGGYALVLVASVPVVLVVSAYVDSLHGVLGLQMESELAAYAGRSVLWPMLMVAILPPLSEEVAFRGILYGGLRRSLSVGEAMFLSSFAFAMLHLSVMSLFTHLPLGAYFCWLRQRSGSLWPGVFAHACHNFGVCLLTWW